ncbi:unnamed protein product [Menidia menidia]|uniref:(Atlantic silverside) hypothetical protein n=1 Tax=Menidia menidia TaxID=238744 RepID=A0A8S4AZ63_9TELE|nr:unnamed protein product [Menidia menidia]
MKQKMETSWAPGPPSLLSLSGFGPLAPPADCFPSKLNQRRGTVQRLDLTLVRELRRALGLAAAASFKHVSPAGKTPPPESAAAEIGL